MIIIDNNELIYNEVNKGGNIFGELSNYKGSNNFIIEIKDINNENNIYKVLSENNKFNFINIKPGVYFLQAYENINPINHSYFNGVLEPLKFGAKFGILENQIEVRSNWDINDVNIIINER